MGASRRAAARSRIKSGNSKNTGYTVKISIFDVAYRREIPNQYGSEPSTAMESVKVLANDFGNAEEKAIANSKKHGLSLTVWSITRLKETIVVQVK